MSRARSRLVGWAGASCVLLISSAADPASAESGVQVSRDGRSALVSKDVGAERWAIARDSRDGSVTGNVFFPGGGEPRFVFCRETGRSGGQVALSCSGADRCPLAPCSADDWVFLADVTLPESFFEAPSGAVSSPSFLSLPDLFGAGSRAAGAAGSAAATGLQITPDASRTLVSKNVGAERWAIARDSRDGSVTGNVFFPGGGEPRFVWCEQTGDDGDALSLSCFGADSCAASPCSTAQWAKIADVELPRSFFEPRAKVAPDEVASALIGRLGEDEAIAAVLLAMDGGYSLRQIVAAALAGRLDATGQIRRPDGSLEEARHDPFGLIAAGRPPSSRLGRPSGIGIALPDLLRHLRMAAGSEGDVAAGEFAIAVILDLLGQGYDASEIVPAIVDGRVVVVIMVGITIVDEKGEPIPPRAPPDPADEVLTPSVPQPEPTPPPGATRTPGPGATPRPTLELCGNGRADDGEACDGSDLAGIDCEFLGFGPGTLRCDGRCRFDTSDCGSAEPVCGNGIRETGEECDGADLRGRGCEDVGFGPGPGLRCSRSCTYDTDDCALPSVCGNDLVEVGEECDGRELDGQTCERLGFEGGGALACDGSCRFDTSACRDAAVCEAQLCPDQSCVPIGADCCGGGKFCSPGTVCVPGEACCPSDQPQLCGASMCIPDGADCCDGSGFCAAGTICAGNGRCCPGAQPELCGDRCVPAGTLCCGGRNGCVPGSKCCGAACVPIGADCCSPGVACPPGSVCTEIPGVCCPADAPKPCVADQSCRPLSVPCP